MKLASMRRVNLNDSKLTIRISTAAKRKASEIAAGRGLSISQLVDELIRQADDGPPSASAMRSIVSEELQKWSSSSGGKAKRRREAARGRST